MWIGTENGGFDLFDRKNNRFIHHSREGENKSLGNVFVTSIFEDSDQNLWIGTINGGLNLFNRNTNTFSKYQHSKKNSKSLCDNNVRIIFEDSRKNLWIGTNEEGLDKLDRKTGGFSHFRNNLLTDNILPSFEINTIAEDDDGNLWIGARNGGVNILNPQTGAVQNYHHDELDANSLRRNSVTNIFKDPKGNIWIGTLGGGINFMNSAGIKFTHYKHNSSKSSLSNNDVAAILEDSDRNLWIGTDGGGLNMFDRKSGKFLHFKHQENNRNSICGNNILSICEDSRGDLWIGTWAKGITVFNKKKNTFRHFKNDPSKSASLSSDNVWKIFEDRDKNIWIGTYGGGLNLYNPHSNSFIHYKYDENNPVGISNNQVITIFEDSKGLLWIGTDGGGLSQFNKKTSLFTHFKHDDSRNSLSYNYVSNIFENSEGNLYIAGGYGLEYLNTRTKHFTVYNASDGFTNDAASGIMEDAKGNLWISATKGITRFNPSTKQFKNFGTEDGLHTNRYNSNAYCKSRTGVMYFGGINGFDEFFPDSVQKVSFDPPLVITHFQVFNKEVAVATDKNDPSPLKKDITQTKTITIPYSSSVISFGFASLHYGVRDRKQYAYKLERFDKTWNEVGTQHTATYTNLDPGEYIFKVKGLNNEGNWSSKIASIRIIIKPPFWMTWWFRLGICLAVVGSGTAFYLFRINTIQAQKTKLQQQVYEQTRQLVVSAEKTELANKELKIKNKELEQFAYVASHDLQEPLRTTSDFVKLIQQQYHGKLDKKADKYLDYITDASDRMKILIKDLLDFSRIGTKVELKEIDCNTTVKDMLADIMSASQEARADIQYTRLPVIIGYPTEVKLLFQNLVLNAIKFRKKDTAPIIKISVQKTDSYWKFAISDNGIGIEQQHSEKIFDIFQRLHTRKEYAGSGIGLSHCKKIVELHKGKIWVESIPREGSTFYFTFPAATNGIAQLLAPFIEKELPVAV